MSQKARRDAIENDPVRRTLAAVLMERDSLHHEVARLQQETLAMQHVSAWLDPSLVLRPVPPAVGVLAAELAGGLAHYAK